MSTWSPRARYSGQHGWFAEVYRNDAPQPYAIRSRFTERGAGVASRRLARKLARLEQKGKLDRLNQGGL